MKAQTKTGNQNDFENAQFEITALKQELDSAHRECHRLKDMNAELECEKEILGTRLTQETLARVEDGFSSKLKIDTLLLENSRLTKALARSEGIVNQTGRRNYDEEKARDCREKGALTVQQQWDLVKEVARLDSNGRKFGEVVEMISNAIPWVRNSNSEIELDIEAIPTTTQVELYNFVFKR